MPTIKTAQKKEAKKDLQNVTVLRYKLETVGFQELNRQMKSIKKDLDDIRKSKNGIDPTHIKMRCIEAAAQSKGSGVISTIELAEKMYKWVNNN